MNGQELTADAIVAEVVATHGSSEDIVTQVLTDHKDEELTAENIVRQARLDQGLIEPMGGGLYKELPPPPGTIEQILEAAKGFGTKVLGGGDPEPPRMTLRGPSPLAAPQATHEKLPLATPQAEIPAMVETSEILGERPLTMGQDPLAEPSPDTGDRILNTLLKSLTGTSGISASALRAFFKLLGNIPGVPPDFLSQVESLAKRTGGEFDAEKQREFEKDWLTSEYGYDPSRELGAFETAGHVTAELGALSKVLRGAGAIAKTLPNIRLLRALGRSTISGTAWGLTHKPGEEDTFWNRLKQVPGDVALFSAFEVGLLGAKEAWKWYQWTKKYGEAVKVAGKEVTYKNMYELLQRVRSPKFSNMTQEQMMASLTDTDRAIFQHFGNDANWKVVLDNLKKEGPQAIFGGIPRKPNWRDSIRIIDPKTGMPMGESPYFQGKPSPVQEPPPKPGVPEAKKPGEMALARVKETPKMTVTVEQTETGGLKMEIEGMEKPKVEAKPVVAPEVKPGVKVKSAKGLIDIVEADINPETKVLTRGLDYYMDLARGLDSAELQKAFDWTQAHDNPYIRRRLGGNLESLPRERPKITDTFEGDYIEPDVPTTKAEWEAMQKREGIKPKPKVEVKPPRKGKKLTEEEKMLRSNQPLVNFIRGRGGIHVPKTDRNYRGEMSDIQESLGTQIVFRTKGVPMDRMLEDLWQEGFLKENGDFNGLVRLLQEEIAGRPQRPMHVEEMAIIKEEIAARKDAIKHAKEDAISAQDDIQKGRLAGITLESDTLDSYAFDKLLPEKEWLETNTSSLVIYDEAARTQLEGVIHHSLVKGEKFTQKGAKYNYDFEVGKDGVALQVKRTPIKAAEQPGLAIEAPEKPPKAQPKAKVAPTKGRPPKFGESEPTQLGLDTEVSAKLDFKKEAKTFEEFEKEVWGESKLDKVVADLSKEVEKVHRKEFTPTVGGAVAEVARAPAGSKRFKFEDPVIESAFQKAKGVRKAPVATRIKNTLITIKNQATRTYEHLPNTAEFAVAKLQLKRREKLRGITWHRAAEIVDGITIKQDAPAHDLFVKEILLRDLAAQSKLEPESALPFGFTKEIVTRELSRTKKYLEANPEVAEAIANRNKVWAALVPDYVREMKSIGMDVTDRMTRIDYYHHQVLQHVQGKSAYTHMGRKRGLKTPTGEGFLKKRKGSELPINVDYLQVEAEVIAKMLENIETAKIIKIIDKYYNIVPSLKANAIAMNDAAVMPFFEDMAKRFNAGVGPQGKLKEAINMYREVLNSKQAMGFSKLGKLASKGELPDTLGGKYETLIDALAEAHNTKAQLPESYSPQLFEYMGWVLDQHKGTAGSGAAATVFKGIAEKKAYMKDILGKDYATWEDVIPEKHQEYQIRDGSVFYMGHTLADQLAQQIMEGSLSEAFRISPEKIRKAMIVGGKRARWVIPDELAATLNDLTRVRQETLPGKISRKALSQWKEKVALLHPKRVVKYNFRNLTGDGDIVIVGNPHSFTRAPKAAYELYNVYKLKKPVTGELYEWFDRGGPLSTLQAQEMGELKILNRLYEKRGGSVPKKVWDKYWRSIRLTTDFRENILRYASYLDYLDQIQKGGGKPKNYGASLRKEVDAIPDYRDKAWKLSNDLVGPYDEISHTGQWVREHLIPFWSFQEINLRRYKRLAVNAAHDHKLAGAIGRKLLTGAAVRSPLMALRMGKLAVGMTAVWGALHAWNNLMYPEEEAALSEQERSTPHLIFGHMDEEGKVDHFIRIGALGEFLEWFGFDDAPQDIKMLLEGKRTLKEVAMDSLTAPLNKIVQGLRPEKAAIELILGKELFPDVRNPRTIRDRGEFLFKQVGLLEEFREVTGKPTRPYKEQFKKFLIYESDTNRNAYYAIKDMVRKAQKEVGKGGGGGRLSKRGNALYYTKLGHRYGDEKAKTKYLEMYVSLNLLNPKYEEMPRDKVVKDIEKNIEQSFATMHPLYGFNKAEKEKFLKSLDSEERRLLMTAMRFYNEVLIGDYDIDGDTISRAIWEIERE